MFEEVSIGILVAGTIISYFIGNLSPATIMGKLHGVDIRKEGSGNPGTTNVLRTLGKKAAACTLLIDILKGLIPVLAGRWIGGELMACCCGTAAFAGHNWPVAYKFKGGKGIATGFGMILGLDWRIGLIALAAAVLGVLVTKRMSCGSIFAAIMFSVATFIFRPRLGIWSVVLALIIIVKHRSNIQRLIRGEEPPLGFLTKKK